MTSIRIIGAKEHNLNSVDITLPKNKLIVFTGLSGSGKSSLAFDTIYAEGQRRYVESLSTYARQFLDKLDKPDVDAIHGLSPAISIDQKTASHNPRSTVGTVTEIYDYLRLLFSSIGHPKCPHCGKDIERQSPQEICDKIAAYPSETTVLILAPILSKKKGEHKNILDDIQQSGFIRVRINGRIMRLDESIALDKQKAHTIEIVVDRLSCDNDNHTRLFESIETALKHAKGLVLIEEISQAFSHLYSEHFSCSSCDFSFSEISPRLFSFNSPIGACTDCKGLGNIFDFDPELIIEDPDLPVRLATQKALNLDRTILGRRLESEAKTFNFDLNTPISKLSKDQCHLLFYGPQDPPKERQRKYRGRWRPVAPKHWEGIITNLKRRYNQTYSEGMRFFFRRFMSANPCPNCHGHRLKPEALSVFINHIGIHEMCALSIRDLCDFFTALKLTKKEKEIAKLLLKEIQSRLNFLENVGLNYLTLNRRANTLSGGEHQRIRLATQIGSGLTGVLYVLDEPSIGLHQKDNQQLLKTLQNLRDLGNTLIVVEHDEETMKAADHIVDIGPKAGRAGGNIIFSGTFENLKKDPTSITAAYLTGKQSISIPFR